MPLWLELLCTPMAAPEAAILRRMRLLWQRACLVLAVSATAYAPLHAATGPAAPCLLAAELGFVLLYGALYAWRKHRADSAWLATGSGERS